MKTNDPSNALRMAAMIELASSMKEGPDGKPSPACLKAMSHIARMPEAELRALAEGYEGPAEEEGSEEEKPAEEEDEEPVRYARAGPVLRHARDMRHPRTQEAARRFLLEVGERKEDIPGIIQAAIAEEDAGHEPGCALAVHYAEVWNRQPPTKEQKRAAFSDLEGSGWCLKKSRDGSWHVEAGECAGGDWEPAQADVDLADLRHRLSFGTSPRDERDKAITRLLFELLHGQHGKHLLHRIQALTDHAEDGLAAVDDRHPHRDHHYAFWGNVLGKYRELAEEALRRGITGQVEVAHGQG